jgi:hypothetical protein
MPYIPAGISAAPKSIIWYPRYTCVRGPHASAIDGINKTVITPINMSITFLVYDIYLTKIHEDPILLRTAKAKQWGRIKN